MTRVWPALWPRPGSGRRRQMIPRQADRRSCLWLHRPTRRRARQLTDPVTGNSFPRAAIRGRLMDRSRRRPALALPQGAASGASPADAGPRHEEEPNGMSLAANDPARLLGLSGFPVTATTPPRSALSRPPAQMKRPPGRRGSLENAPRQALSAIRPKYCRNGSFLSSTITPLPSAIDSRIRLRGCGRTQRSSGRPKPPCRRSPPPRQTSPRQAQLLRVAFGASATITPCLSRSACARMLSDCSSPSARSLLASACAAHACARRRH